MRPDTALIDDAVDMLTSRTRFPVAFGGLERDGAVHVSAVSGARTRHLDGLVVQAGRGLGGRALVERRPRLALDYRSSRIITHDYDGAVLGEGITTLVAVPIVVRERARGILYCGAWAPSAVTDVALSPAFAVADEIANELHQRVTTQEQPSMDAAATIDREELRHAYADLRALTATVDDPELRKRLRTIEHRLAAVSSGAQTTGIPRESRPSPRELDVLACIALGSKNAEIAQTLGLKETTVKSYLQSVMLKLDVSGRHAAVVKARRVGLLP